MLQFLLQVLEWVQGAAQGRLSESARPGETVGVTMIPRMYRTPVDGLSYR